MNPIARQKLIQLVTRFGRDICEDPRRCEALLHDIFGDQYQREVNVLAAAAKERAAAELAAHDRIIPSEVLVAKLSARLHANLGFQEDLARWSIDSWALALGVIEHAPDYPVSTQKVEYPQENTAEDLGGRRQPSGRKKAKRGRAKDSASAHELSQSLEEIRARQEKARAQVEELRRKFRSLRRNGGGST